MSDINPKIPIDFSALKDTVRMGLTSSASRTYWWPYLPNITGTGPIEQYPDLIEIAERLANMLPDVSNTISSTSESVKGRDRDIITGTAASVMQVLVRTKIISPQETAGFETLLRIIVHQMKRADVSLMMAGDLLSNREK